MIKYIIKRLLLMIPVVLGVTILIFAIMYFTPGDPAQIALGPNATAAEVAAKRVELGLDDPFFIRLGRYLKDVYLHFDLGNSYLTGKAVASELMERFPRTALISVLCMLISIAIGIPLGINAAIHQDGLWDRLSMFVALFGVSIPNFWLALMLVIVFALKLGILPAYGLDGLQYYILPCVSLSFGGIAQQARQTRSSMLEVVRSDYIVTARAKGLSEWSVILKHALPNALIPVITVAGTQFGYMLGGALVIETVFSIPGIGMYLINGISSRDYMVVQGCVVVLAIAFSFVMLGVDLIYAFVDPRIKSMYRGK